MTERAHQSAELVGSPCVNCKREPCECLGSLVGFEPVPSGELRPKGRRVLRRYRFADGSVLRLDEAHGARAAASGAELLDPEDAA